MALTASTGRDNDWQKVALGYALTLKLRTVENGLLPQGAGPVECTP